MRNYKPKGPRRPWRNKDKRMILAVRLVREEGKSLRQAAKVLGVTHPTVLADLRRWDAARSNVVRLPVNRGGKSGAISTTPAYHPRTTAEAMGIPPHPVTVREEWQARAVEVLNDWR